MADAAYITLMRDILRRLLSFRGPPDATAAKPDACAEARAAMVREQLIPAGVGDERILDAMGRVPRERFVSLALRDIAYSDGPLAIGEGQTISQPALVARMLEALRLQPADRVLEVGAGSGYVAALLSLLVERVTAVEIVPPLAAAARERLAMLGFDNVLLLEGDGTLGDDEEMFDAIIVSAGSRRGIPETLKRRLKIGGRLMVPAGDASIQELVLVTRLDRDTYAQQDFGPVVFVPLR